MAGARIRDVVPEWRPAWIVQEQHRAGISTRRWAPLAGLTLDQLRAVRLRSDALACDVEAAARGLRLDLAAVLVRHGVRLDVGDMGGSGLAAERRRRGLTVRRVAARARLPVETVMALEGPDAGDCSIDELGAYAAAVGVRLGAAVRCLDVVPGM